MTRLLRSEVQKLATIWSTYILIALSATAAGLLGVAVAFAPHNRQASNTIFPARGSVAWFDLVFSVMSVAQTVALILGILVMTGEYRYRTATPTYLAEPRRGRVTLAKMGVSALGGLVAAVAAGAGSLLLGFGLAAAGIGSTTEMLTEYRHVFPGVLAASLLFAVYGAGLGAMLKNQVVALVVGLGITAIIEPITVAVWPSVGRWLPSEAARSLASVTARPGTGGGIAGETIHLVSSWEGAVVLLAYGLILAVAGSMTTLRADVT